MTLADGKVLAEVEFFDNAAVIYEWSSLTPGRGDTNVALAELRSMATLIVVCGIGTTSDDESWRYWQHQLSGGRVDELWDDEGHRVLAP